MGCGGGSDSTETGSVAVLLADAPTDEYRNIFIELEEVSLEPGNVVLFADPDGLEVDLLDLRDEDLLLAVDDGVPAGTYERIVLQVGSIRTVGGPCDDLDIKLPSGRIRLNAQSPIEVRPGESLSVRLDVDANKSLALHTAGASGKCIFRPVVFVDVEREVSSGRCPRTVRGEITELIRGDGEEVVGLVLDLADGRGDVRVVVSESTAIFDAAGESAMADALAVGQTVHVRGRLDAERRLVALGVIIGDVLVVEGLVASALVDGAFGLEADEGEAVVGAVDVDISEETLLIDHCSHQASQDDLVVGRRVRVIGKLEEGRLRALAVVVRSIRDDFDLVEVEDVEGDDVRVTLRDEGDGEVSFLVAADAILFEGDGVANVDLLSSVLACRTLDVRVTPDPEDGDRLREVRVDVDDEDGDVVSVDPELRRLVVDESVVHVSGDATVLDTRDGAHALADFGDLAAGQEVRVFGLDSCPGGDVDMEAVVVVIVDRDEDETESEDD